MCILTCRSLQDPDAVVTVNNDGANAGSMVLGQEGPQFPRSALFRSGAAEGGAGSAVPEMEGTYAAFDQLPSSTSLSKLGSDVQKSVAPYPTEGEARLYHMDASDAESTSTLSSQAAKVAVSLSQQETPEQFKGVPPSRPMTTRRAARGQLVSDTGGGDDHGMSKVFSTTNDHQENSDGSVDVAVSKETRTKNAARSNRNPTTTAQNVDQWNTRLQELIEYKAQHGHCNVPFCYDEKPFLAAWVKRQRYQYKCKVRGKHSHLTDEREALLEQLGFVWDTHVAAWEENYALMVEFYRLHGHCYVPIKQKELSTWAKRQRRHYKQYQQSPDVTSTTMTDDRIRRLNEIEFPWTTTMRPSSKVMASKGNSSGNSSSATSQNEVASVPTGSTNDIAATAENETRNTVQQEAVNDMGVTTSSPGLRSSTGTVITSTRGARRRGRSRDDDKKEGKEKGK